MADSGGAISIVTDVDHRAWRQFVERTPDGNVFHSPEMAQVFARTQGYQPATWAAVDRRGEILALLPIVQVTLHDGLLRRLTSRAIAYGGVLWQPGDAGLAALEGLLRAYTRATGAQVLFIELRNLSSLGSAQQIVQDCGFVYEDHLDYLIDLTQPVEALLQSLGARTRKHIRQALKRQDIVIEECASLDQVRECCRLIEKSYAAAHTPLVDHSLFEAAFELLYPHGMVKFLLARLGTQPVAASVELPYKDTIYGWYSGVDREYAAYTPNEVLMWHILQWGAEHGYRVYDFGGAGRPEQAYRVRDFKAKFGGRLVCFGRNRYVRAPGLLHLSSFGYQLLRQWL
ncbi:MAG TPA: GNAT family N-acetyltransferase [Anaerolineae bacterium]|nr:GNAT family N-acetyltransferase [Anaerolineae bacterium]